ncbi:MAG: DUF805 domain-containing protein [Actinomycetaceae bacterium]|nr:DUF805 domain-containing protein [Actinomycetaceae bacterium]
MNNESQWAYQQQGTPAYPAAPAPVYVVEPPLDQPWYGIDIVNATKRFFQKYATFSGRASRGEFWWSYLALILASFVLGFVELIPVIGVIVGLVFSFGTIIPSLAVSVRRLHDTNRSGWFLLIPFGLSIVGCIILFASFVPAIIDLAETSNIDYMTDEEALELLTPVFGGAAIALVLLIISAIVNIVFMASASNPAGVRFDKPAPMQGMPMGTQALPQSYPTQPYSQPDYGQQAYGQQAYGQFPTEQQPPEEQSPYSPMQ